MRFGTFERESSPFRDLVTTVKYVQLMHWQSLAMGLYLELERPEACVIRTIRTRSPRAQTHTMTGDCRLGTPHRSGHDVPGVRALRCSGRLGTCMISTHGDQQLTRSNTHNDQRSLDMVYLPHLFALNSFATHFLGLQVDLGLCIWEPQIPAHVSTACVSY